MAKSKFADKAEAKEALSQAKEDRKSAKAELKAFEKEHDLEVGGDHSGDAKHGKRWSKLKKVVDAKEAAVSSIESEMEGMKSAKAVRPSKYEYPAAEGGGEMTAAEKKRYRAKMRTEAKKKEKGEEAPKSSKKKKKSKEVEDVAVSETPAKSSGKSASKKAKKKAAEAEVAED